MVPQLISKCVRVPTFCSVLVLNQFKSWDSDFCRYLLSLSQCLKQFRIPIASCACISVFHFRPPQLEGSKLPFWKKEENKKNLNLRERKREEHWRQMGHELNHHVAARNLCTGFIHSAHIVERQATECSLWEACSMNLKQVNFYLFAH